MLPALGPVGSRGVCVSQEDETTRNRSVSPREDGDDHKCPPGSNSWSGVGHGSSAMWVIWFRAGVVCCIRDCEVRHMKHDIKGRPH